MLNGAVVFTASCTADPISWIANSHPHKVLITTQGQIQFLVENITLVDQNVLNSALIKKVNGWFLSN
jgi:hypothetical protein